MYDIVVLEPTLKCNLLCLMCDRSLLLRNDGNGEPGNQADYEKILDRLPHIPREFYVSGGEPTLWPGLVDLCSSIVNLGLPLSIQTNGTHPEVVKALMDAGVTHFNLSVDGPEAVHDSIRGGGTHDKFLQTVSAISSRKNCRFVTTTVISDFNIQSVDKLFFSFKKRRINPAVMIFELARRFDAETIQASAACAGVNVSEIPVACLETRRFQTELSALERAIARIEELSKSYSRKIMLFPRDLGRKTKLFCDYSVRQNARVKCSHRNVMRIDPAGNVVPCFTFRNTLGNIFKDEWDMIRNMSVSFWERMERNNLAPVCETCFRCVECEE